MNFGVTASIARDKAKGEGGAPGGTSQTSRHPSCLPRASPFAADPAPLSKVGNGARRCACCSESIRVFVFRTGGTPGRALHLPDLAEIPERNLACF